MLLHQLFGLQRIDVADRHHRHQVGAVPVAVKTGQGVRLEAAQHLFGADRQALGVLRTVEDRRHDLLAHAVRGAFAEAQLFQHDAAFLLDRIKVEAQTMGPVFQHLEGFRHVLGLVGGDRQDVDGLVERGIGIQVGPVADADRLQVGHQLMLVEVGRAVEGHVLHEMGHAALVLVFEDGAGLDHQAQLELALGAGIALDVIAQAVGELAHLDLRADRDRGVQAQRRRRTGTGLGGGLRGSRGGMAGQRLRTEQRGHAQTAHEILAHRGSSSRDEHAFYRAHRRKLLHSRICMSNRASHTATRPLASSAAISCAGTGRLYR